MGAKNSKVERSTALKLCKERKKFMKQAIDSRYALAAAHVSYVQSLRNIGIALRRYAEAEVVVESTGAASVDKTPTLSSCCVSDSPSPLSPPKARVSYMRSTGASTLTVRVSPPPNNVYVEEGEFPMPPPPPPPPEPGASWDYFDPSDESFRFVGLNLNIDDDASMYGDFEKKGLDGIIEEKLNGLPEVEEKKILMVKSDSRKSKSSVEKESSADREDPSEFITHRAKDFLSSIKDIDSRFFRASESGREVSRMLESSKIHVGFADARGTPSSSFRLSSFGAACCNSSSSTHVYDDQHATKVITWKRTTSSRSSSSRNPLATKEDNDDSGSHFIEEFCMISGSHTSTLERLYAWERKLYDEVKACESIQKEYDQKCDQLRHQFAKDLKGQDKTRAVVRDLHSRIRVAIHAVDSISKRIEKMREEELLPQLQELIQGLTRMWKAMLECHHSQYITISLAYHSKNPAPAPQGETPRQIIIQLQTEVEYFGLGFADWINSYTSYVESLNNWLQNCILQPREKKGRRAFSPRRYLAPPIFVLCRDWSTGIKALPSQEVSDAFKTFMSDLRNSLRKQAEEANNKETTNGETETNGGHVNEERRSDMNCIQESLTKVLDRLTKFSEASVKMCEDIKKKCESARNAYDNYRAPPRSFSI